MLSRWRYAKFKLSNALDFRNRPNLKNEALQHIQWKNKVIQNEQEKQFYEDLQLYPSFITPGEHDYLVDFVSPLLDSAEYYSAHWDQVISEYREMELHIDKWDKECRNIFSRQRGLFPEGTNWKEKIHVLDLLEGGRIDHHIDSVDASGSIVSGISLLSDSVFQLKDEITGSEVSVYLPKRSLYVMKNFVRYNYGHAIQPGEVDFNGKKIKKTRRISIISRDKLHNHE